MPVESLKHQVIRINIPQPSACLVDEGLSDGINGVYRQSFVVGICAPCAQPKEKS
jgi:hypothetical protein